MKRKIYTDLAFAIGNEEKEPEEESPGNESPTQPRPPRSPSPMKTFKLEFEEIIPEENEEPVKEVFIPLEMNVELKTRIPTPPREPSPPKTPEINADALNYADELLKDGERILREIRDGFNEARNQVEEVKEQKEKTMESLKENSDTKTMLSNHLKSKMDQIESEKIHKKVNVRMENFGSPSSRGTRQGCSPTMKLKTIIFPQSDSEIVNRNFKINSATEPAHFNSFYSPSEMSVVSQETPNEDRNQKSPVLQNTAKNTHNMPNGTIDTRKQSSHIKPGLVEEVLLGEEEDEIIQEEPKSTSQKKTMATEVIKEKTEKRLKHFETIEEISQENNSMRLSGEGSNENILLRGRSEETIQARKEKEQNDQNDQLVLESDENQEEQGGPAPRHSIMDEVTSEKVQRNENQGAQNLKKSVPLFEKKSFHVNYTFEGIMPGTSSFLKSNGLNHGKSMPKPQTKSQINPRSHQSSKKPMKDFSKSHIPSNPRTTVIQKSNFSSQIKPKKAKPIQEQKTQKPKQHPEEFKENLSPKLRETSILPPKSQDASDSPEFQKADWTPKFPQKKTQPKPVTFHNAEVENISMRSEKNDSESNQNEKPEFIEGFSLIDGASECDKTSPKKIFRVELDHKSPPFPETEEMLENAKRNYELWGKVKREKGNNKGFQEAIELCSQITSKIANSIGKALETFEKASEFIEDPPPQPRVNDFESAIDVYNTTSKLINVSRISNGKLGEIIEKLESSESSFGVAALECLELTDNVVCDKMDGISGLKEQAEQLIFDKKTIGEAIFEKIDEINSEVSGLQGLITSFLSRDFQFISICLSCFTALQFLIERESIKTQIIEIANQMQNLGLISEEFLFDNYLSLKEHCKSTENQIFMDNHLVSEFFQKVYEKFFQEKLLQKFEKKHEKVTRDVFFQLSLTEKETVTMLKTEAKHIVRSLECSVSESELFLTTLEREGNCDPLKVVVLQTVLNENFDKLKEMVSLQNKVIKLLAGEKTYKVFSEMKVLEKICLFQKNCRNEKALQILDLNELTMVGVLARLKHYNEYLKAKSTKFYFEEITKFFDGFMLKIKEEAAEASVVHFV